MLSIDSSKFLFQSLLTISAEFTPSLFTTLPLKPSKSCFLFPFLSRKPSTDRYGDLRALAGRSGHRDGPVRGVHPRRRRWGRIQYLEGGWHWQRRLHRVLWQPVDTSVRPVRQTGALLALPPDEGKWVEDFFKGEIVRKLRSGSFWSPGWCSLSCVGIRSLCKIAGNFQSVN